MLTVGGVKRQIALYDSTTDSLNNLPGEDFSFKGL